MNNGQSEVQIAPPITVPGSQLEEAERLKIENAYLRLQNMQYQMQSLDAAKAQLIEEMRRVQAEMETYRAELSAKYGCDISRTNVTADGTIVRNAATPRA